MPAHVNAFRFTDRVICFASKLESSVELASRQYEFKLSTFLRGLAHEKRTGESCPLVGCAVSRVLARQSPKQLLQRIVRQLRSNRSR